MKKKMGKGEGMIDIGAKKQTKRNARAQARVFLNKKAFDVLCAGATGKGDILETAKIAGIMAAKKTPELIPYCHPLSLTKAHMSFEMDDKQSCVRVFSEVEVSGQTGVEMEAMVAVSAAALTIYDMLKFIDKGMVISDVCLLQKTGGKSGDYMRQRKRVGGTP